MAMTHLRCTVWPLRALEVQTSALKKGAWPSIKKGGVAQLSKRGRGQSFKKGAWPSIQKGAVAQHSKREVTKHSKRGHGQFIKGHTLAFKKGAWHIIKKGVWPSIEKGG